MGWGSSLARAPEAIRDLPGVQPATALVWLSRGFSFAGCTPSRTLIGLRLPDRGKNPTPGPAYERCARLPKPASACGPNAGFHIGGGVCANPLPGQRFVSTESSCIFLLFLMEICCFCRILLLYLK